MRVALLMAGATAVVALASAACSSSDTAATTSASSTQHSEAGTTSATSTQQVEVNSSLEGVNELPGHIRWIATTSLPEERVEEVRFLINERLRWVDQDEPYMYGGDRAYLVTTWLYPDIHDFTVQVVDSSGEITGTTISARVPERKQQQNQGLWGILGRVPEALLKKPPDRWWDHWTAEMYIAGSGGELWVGRSYEDAYAYEISVRGKTLRILAPIHKAPPGVPYTEQGWIFDGDLCSPAGPFATYAYNSEASGGDPLAGGVRIRARKDPCEKRRALLEGFWQYID
jgi:hypothetical protein